MQYNILAVALAAVSGQVQAQCEESFAKETLLKKYIKMNEPEWKDYNETQKLEKFCPYQTNLDDDRSVIHQWPNCDYRLYKEGDPPCFDRTHMFNWMVYELTGLEPAKAYRCIQNNLNIFDPDFEQNAAVIQDGGKDMDFSPEKFGASEKTCKSKGGMVVFNQSPKFTTNTNNWYSADKHGDIFGQKMIQYCYYTPGMSASRVCKDHCNELDAASYFVTNPELKMYCRNLKSTELKAEDLVIRPSVNAFNNYLENKFQFRGIVVDDADENSGAVQSSGFFVLLGFLLFCVL